MSDEKRHLPVKWADEAMYDARPISKQAQEAPRVHLLWATPDPLGAIAAFCKMYEGKVVEDLHMDVSDDEREHYWTQANATHLKAPLETVEFHFLIEGVTRSFTHQMVRQRTAVYAQESLRFAVKPDLSEGVRPGPSIRGDQKRQRIYDEAIDAINEAYHKLIADGVPAEDARGLLPHDTLTRLHYKTNLRNLAEHAGNRLCTQAQFEWRFVLSSMVKAIRHHRGKLEQYGYTNDGPQEIWNTWQYIMIADSNIFRPVCYAHGSCPFLAQFDRHCEIRDRVQAGEFDKIDPAEWLLDPNAARKS